MTMTSDELKWNNFEMLEHLGIPHAQWDYPSINVLVNITILQNTLSTIEFLC